VTVDRPRKFNYFISGFQRWDFKIFFFTTGMYSIPGECSQVVLRTGECPAEDVVHRVLGHNDPEAAHMEAQAVRLAVQVKIQLPSQGSQYK
jgi:hypothetical protein